MRLVRKPKRPKWRPFVQVSFGAPMHESWKHIHDIAYWSVSPSASDATPVTQVSVSSSVALNGLTRTLASTGAVLPTVTVLLVTALPAVTPSFGWVGPSPRVTRALSSVAQTRAAWVGAWPPNTTNQAPPQRAVGDAVAEVIANELNARGYFGGPWRVTWVPYAPAQHGSLAWWRDGTASVTRTRDAFPEFAARLSAAENPTGPTTRENRPATAGEVAGEVLGGAAGGAASGISKVKDVLVVAAVVAVPLAVAWTISSIRGIQQDLRPRRNPRGRR
jgi:hypothetical protein